MNTLDFVDKTSLRDDLPAFHPGDTINVHVKVIEGEKERTQIFDGTVRTVLQDWELPPMDLWAVFPAGRTPMTKARMFADFVEGVMHASAGIQRRPGPNSPGRMFE